MTIITKNNWVYKKWYIKISDLHDLYYELYGNPNGIPILFIHWWPWSGFWEFDKDFFDKWKYNVIFFDQRWAWKSKPFGCIKNNKTMDLVDDINKVLDYLKIYKVYIFGGSWWSTLALIYSINYSERVLGMILRGVFLGNKYSIKYYLEWWIKEFFPDVWDRFISITKKSKNIEKYYFKKMLSINQDISYKYLYEWAFYKMSISKINKIDNIDKEIKQLLRKSSLIIEAYYLINKCFVKEDYILNNIEKIKDLKISIVQWRYDFTCPPIQAYSLHSKLNNSNLSIVTAWHSYSEEEIKKKLIVELKKITKI